MSTAERRRGVELTGLPRLLKLLVATAEDIVEVYGEREWHADCRVYSAADSPAAAFAPDASLM